MYQCKKCQKPLTEFDVNFYNNVYRNAPVPQCSCQECTIGKEINKIIKKHEDFKRYSWLCWLSPASIAILIIGSLIWPSTIYNLMYVSDFAYGFLVMSGVFMGYSCVVSWIVGAIKTIGGFNLDLESYEIGSHFETTYNKSTGTYTTKSVSDYSDSKDGAKAFWLGITYPFWSFPYFIYKNIKFLGECPAEIRHAHAKTMASTPRIVISKSFIKKREKQIQKYNSKASMINKTYSVLGEKEINKRLAKIRKPSFVLTINQIKYRVIDNRGDCLWYLQQQGKTKEKILIDNYLLYSDDNANSLFIDWKKLGSMRYL